MKVLVFDTGEHIRLEPLQAALPDVEFIGATMTQEALANCRDCEVLVSVSHAVSDDLVRAMPALRYMLSLTTGVDHLGS